MKNSGQCSASPSPTSTTPSIPEDARGSNEASSLRALGKQDCRALDTSGNPLQISATKYSTPTCHWALTPIQIPQSSMRPVQGGASATNQHIRLPSSEDSKPFLTVAPERKSAVQSLRRSLQLGNRQCQGNVTGQDSLIQSLLHKLECIPVHDLEPRVRSWQESMPLLETRVQGLLEAASRPDAAPEIVAAYDQAKQELERAKTLLIKARSILNRKPAQALHQIPQAHTNTFRQVDPRVQVTDRMTAALREPAQPGGHVAEQVPNVFGWKSQPGPSNVLQLPFQVYTPSNSVNPYHSVPSPDHDAGQRNPRPPSLRHGQWDKAVPRNRTSFLHLVRLWLLQTGRGIDVIPRIDDKPLDLHELFSDVETLGGAENVQAKGLWPLVWVGMGYTVDEQNDPQPAQIAEFLADVYTSFLVPFKLFCMDRLRPADSVIQYNRLVQQALAQQVRTRANQGVPPVPEAGPAIVIPSDGTAALPLANVQQILALLQVTLEDWLPELPLQAKIVRAAEMNPPTMQNEGWSAERINLIWRFRPALLQFRETVIGKQEQTLSQLPHSESDIGITSQGGIGDGKAEPSSQSSSPIKHPSISGQESGREKGETESKVEKPTVRGKKRHLEGKHEQRVDGQGATPKRGKIIHQVR